uniref:Small ribosomal subunit protein uS15c n=1 Tax=Prasinococcus sp. CCMP1194 TaxID=110672 RepID=A0A088CIZ1_9VIRI|nr:ribosomal protein S15 [Prasinococcus sp. CCMP1194]
MTQGINTGSSHYQIGVLTTKIQNLSLHLRKNKKDYASRRGLMKMLSQRKKLLKYLYRTNIDLYQSTLKTFQIRPLKF